MPDHLIERVGRTLTLGSGCTPSARRPTQTTEAAASMTTETTNERFAYWCFDLLFLGCSNRFGDAPSEGSESESSPGTILLPQLTARCEDTLLSYARDLEIRGMIPMQRIRQEELNYILQRYLELRLWPGTYSASARREWAGTRPNARISSQPISICCCWLPHDRPLALQTLVWERRCPDCTRCCRAGEGLCGSRLGDWRGRNNE